MYQNVIILCIAILVTLIFISVTQTRQRAQGLASDRNTTYYYKPSDVRSLIAAKEIHGRENQMKPLEARSLPNKSLRQTFKIHNPFTSSEEEYVKELVKTSRDIVNISSDQWKIIAVTTQDAVTRWKIDAQGPCGSRAKIKLVPLVQSFTLKAVLTAFFFIEREATTEDVPFEALTKLSESINDSWIRSKEENTLVTFENNDKLQAALLEVLPDANISDPHKNPLNLILPGFETMWRVVLRAFVEVAYKTGKEHPNWREALLSYSEKPTAEQFSQASPPDGASTKDLVKETFRLYPPTKRVYRAWKEASSPEPKEMTADIEACHLSVSIWGQAARKFDPSRWQKVTKEQEEAFLPFGSKPFECPAKSLFGPRLVGLLVGKLLGAFSHDWNLTSLRGDTVTFGAERLSNERSGYHDLYLEPIRGDF